MRFAALLPPFFTALAGLAGSAWAQPADTSRVARSDSLFAPAPTGLGYDLGFGTGYSRIEATDAVSGDVERERYFMVSFMPEVRYGAWSGGLLVNLRVNTRTGALRQEDYDAFGDLLGTIYFLQYGEARGFYRQHERQVYRYARFGALDDVRLGYGQFVDRYRNTISLDAPKRGLAWDVENERFRFEGLYSSALEAEVFGLRGSARPYLEHVFPWMRRLVVGATLAGDLSDAGRLVNEDAPGEPFYLGSQPSGSTRVGVGQSDGTLLLLGADVGLLTYRSDAATVVTFAEVGTIFGHGLGLALGVQGLRTLREGGYLEGRFEQRILGPSYLPNYFNALYEVARVRVVEREDGRIVLNTKRNRLIAQEGTRLGSGVSAGWRYRRRFRLRTSYEHLWEETGSGWFHLDLELKSPDVPLYLTLSYDRIGVGEAADLLRVRSRDALVRLGVAYRFFRYVMLGVGFRQSYEAFGPITEASGAAKRNRLEPLLSVVIPN